MADLVLVAILVAFIALCARVRRVVRPHHRPRRSGSRGRQRSRRRRRSPPSTTGGGRMIAAAASTTGSGSGWPCSPSATCVAVLDLPGALLMSLAGHRSSSLAARPRCSLVTVPPLGRYMAEVFGARGRRPGARRPVFVPRRAAASTGSLGVDPQRSSAGTSTRSRCWRSPRVARWCCTLLLRLQGSPAVQPDRP